MCANLEPIEPKGDSFKLLFKIHEFSRPVDVEIRVAIKSSSLGLDSDLYVSLVQRFRLNDEALVELTNFSFPFQLQLICHFVITICIF